MSVPATVNGFSRARSTDRFSNFFGPKLSSDAVTVPAFTGTPFESTAVTVNVARSPQA